MNEAHSVAEVAQHFADIVGRVVDQGERFVLTLGNKPVAELRPLPAGKPLAELPGLLGPLPRLSEAEAGDFVGDLIAERSRSARWPE